MNNKISKDENIRIEIMEFNNWHEFKKNNFKKVFIKNINNMQKNIWYKINNFKIFKTSGIYNDNWNLEEMLFNKHYDSGIAYMKEMLYEQEIPEIINHVKEKFKNIDFQKNKIKIAVIKKNIYFDIAKYNNEYVLFIKFKFQFFVKYEKVNDQKFQANFYFYR